MWQWHDTSTRFKWEINATFISSDLVCLFRVLFFNVIRLNKFRNLISIMSRWHVQKHCHRMDSSHFTWSFRTCQCFESILKWVLIWERKNGFIFFAILVFMLSLVFFLFGWVCSVIVPILTILSDSMRNSCEFRTF